MRVVLTRAGPEAPDWAQALHARGFHVVDVPLLAVGPAPDPVAVDRVRRGLGDFQALMFVSGNAVRGLLPDRSLRWPAAVRAWATGPGTTGALRAAGVPPACIDAPPAEAGQYDSEHLWAVVASQVHPGSRVLLVRGADSRGQVAGRDWLAQQLREAGAQVEAVAAYSRAVPAWTAQQRQAAQAALSDGSVWLFSSSEAVANLRQLLPDAQWPQARALATHERIAQAAQAAGFGVVRTSRPDLPSVMAALESIG